MGCTGNAQCFDAEDTQNIIPPSAIASLRPCYRVVSNDNKYTLLSYNEADCSGDFIQEFNEVAAEQCNQVATGVFAKVVVQATGSTTGGSGGESSSAVSVAAAGTCAATLVASALFAAML